MGIKNILEFGKERVEADRGYVDYEYIDGPEEDGGGGEAQIKMKKRVRGRHETVNRRFKQWNILQDRFRHDLNKHYHVFSAIAAITQMDIRAGNKLYQIHGYKTKQSALRTHNINMMLKLKRASKERYPR